MVGTQGVPWLRPLDASRRGSCIGSGDDRVGRPCGLMLVAIRRNSNNSSSSTRTSTSTSTSTSTRTSTSAATTVIIIATYRY